MPTFAYSGRTRTGQTITGEHIADASQNVVDNLKGDGPAPPPDDGTVAGVDGGGGATTPASDPLVIDLGIIESNVDTPFDVPAGALGFNVVIDGTVEDYDDFLARARGFVAATDVAIANLRRGAATGVTSLT